MDAARVRLLRSERTGGTFSQPLRAGEFDELLTRHFAPATDLQGQY
jgi:hypothetical protein